MSRLQRVTSTRVCLWSMGSSSAWETTAGVNSALETAAGVATPQARWVMLYLLCSWAQGTASSVLQLAMTTRVPFSTTVL
jgi:hypothetical protein